VRDGWLSSERRVAKLRETGGQAKRDGWLSSERRLAKLRETGG
jgi:hypothetical protein